MKVAVVGARGIGKHHAKWLAKAGCEVAALYGTTPDSAEAAAAGLRELFDFDGAVFSDWRRFVTEGDFEACSICSPADCHLENVRDLAATGKHLLCEKPLVWIWERSPLRLMEDARQVVEAIEAAGVIGAVNAQYPAALEGFRALYRQVRGREPTFEALEFLLETKGKPRSPHGPAEAWVDLAPHPLALIDSLAPGGIDWETLRVHDGPHEFAASFDWLSKGQRIPVRLAGGRITEGVPKRRLGNQDLVADYDGTNVEGEFMARLRFESHEWIGPDLMRTSVERFVDAVRTGNPEAVLVSPHAALRQQGALVGVWERTWSGGNA